jgi:hypothetical protein
MDWEGENMNWYWWIGTVQLAIALIGGVCGVVFVILASGPDFIPFDGLIDPAKTTKLVGFMKGTLFTGATLVLADVIIKALPYAPNGFRMLLLLLGVQVTQVVIAAVVVIIGYLAFRFKGANQSAYGTVEVMVAAATAIATVKNVANVHDFRAVAFSLAATVYVVSRGLGNYKDGQKPKTNLLTGAGHS